jgi:hypothetical protein
MGRLEKFRWQFTKNTDGKVARTKKCRCQVQESIWQGFRNIGGKDQEIQMPKFNIYKWQGSGNPNGKVQESRWQDSKNANGKVKKNSDGKAQEQEIQMTRFKNPHGKIQEMQMARTKK